MGATSWAAISLGGVELLNPWLAPALVLAAIPLILYLLERRRTPVVDWPAMRFFLAVLRRSIRRMQFRELLLVTLRTLVMALVVMALMRPGRNVSGLHAASGAGPRGVVVLLDNSYSMAYRGAEERVPSRWEMARAAALQVLAGLAPGDLAQVATLAGAPAALSPEPLRNLEDARAAVRGAALAGGEADVLAGLDLAADLASALPAKSRDVYILSDFQERGWAAQDQVRWSFVRDRLASLDPAPRLLAVDVGAEKPLNHAVLSLDTERPVVGTDRRVEIVARVAQFGDPAPRALELQLVVDGVARESRSVDVRDGAPAQVRFHHRFTVPGSHRVEARLAPDGLAEDDSRGLALDVVDRLPVLIVAGSAPGGSLFAGDGDLLALAFAPHARGTPVPEVLFRPQLVGTAEFALMRAADLSAYRLVVLADVPALDAGPEERLEEYVRAGGGLLIFAGERASAPAYNQDLLRRGRGVLPARLLEAEGRAGDEPLSPAGLLEGHPAFAELGSPVRSELARVRIHRWWRTAPAAGSTVIAELKEGVPFLIEKPCGRGRVILCATGPRVETSNLPERPLFVPLLHGLAYHLSAPAEDRRNVLLGGTLVERLDKLEPGASAVVRDPTGGVHGSAIETLAADVPLAGRHRVAFGPVEVPGFYTMTVRAPSGERSAVFAANLDTRESDLRRLEPDAMARLSAERGIRVVREVGDLAPGDGGGPVRTEWWRPLLSAAIALLLMEVLLTSAFARGRAPFRPPDRAARTSESGAPPDGAGSLPGRAGSRSFVAPG